MSVSILCVYEDRELARVHAETLEAEGFEVICAHDGRQTSEILRSRHPDFIVLDAYLPRQDGFEILAEIRKLEALRLTPVLMLSEGDITPEISQRAADLGAIGIESSPLPMDRLVARVAEFVKRSEGAVEPESALPISGSLCEMPLPEILHGLRLERHTGVVLFEHGKKKKAAEFSEGWPISVKSNLVSECLGRYLLRNRLCGQEELDESISRLQAGEGMQGQILVAMEVLDEAAMAEALHQHALEKFFELFGWRDGNFSIRHCAHIQGGSTIAIEGHPEKLIIEGVKRNYPLKLIDRYLAAHMDQCVVPVTSGEEYVTEIGLDARELEWVAGLDGSTTLGDLSAAPEWVKRLAFGFISIEFLSVEAIADDQRDARGIVGRVARGREASAPNGDEAVRIELADLASRIQDRDCFGVLDVPPTADDDEIRIAFACLAKQIHPDRFHGSSSSVRQLASKVFDRIAMAHEAIATADVRRVYAEELAQGRRLEAVEDEGRRALLAETEFQKGAVKMVERDYQGALLCFGRATENFSSEGEYRSYYGWCLHLCYPDNDLMLGEAVEHCREGVKLAKGREKPYLLLGRLYKVMGKMGAAKNMFSRAVEIRPQSVEAMRELRIMNMRRNKSQGIAQGIVQGMSEGVLKRIFRR
ncbi:MAG: response regulator [bacterium]|nr:response regulator [bacterium]